ncbi:MAG: hypothetical protein OXU61_02965 [Gammaproteobacteria bacterium]|nr:hypothetical protein [Gammaproteobacteria bacterium]
MTAGGGNDGGGRNDKGRQEWRSGPCVRTLDALPANTRMLDSRFRGNGGEGGALRAPFKAGGGRRAPRGVDFVDWVDGVDFVDGGRRGAEWRGGLYSLNARGVFARPGLQYS